MKWSRVRAPVRPALAPCRERLGEKRVAVSDLEVTDDWARDRTDPGYVIYGRGDEGRLVRFGPTPTRREDPLAELTEREREVLGRTLSRRRPDPGLRLPHLLEARLPDKAMSFEPSDQVLDDRGLCKLLRRSKHVWREQPCA